MALGCFNGFLPGSEPGTFPSVPPPPPPAPGQQGAGSESTLERLLLMSLALLWSRNGGGAPL